MDVNKYPDNLKIYKPKKNRNKSKSNHSRKLFCLAIILMIIGLLELAIIKGNKKQVNIIINKKKKIKKKSIIYNDDKYISKLEKLEMNKSNDIEFNQKINEKLIDEQNNFCNNINYFNQKFEDLILLWDASFLGNFQMFIYKKNDTVSRNIFYKKQWEVKETNNLLNALNYYSKKSKIKNEDIYILDIGANIGWYSITLGRFGYKIFAFEPYEINNYILKKNYCLNKGINVTIINKGLDTEEKICYRYNFVGGEGNGMVICDKNITLPYFIDKNRATEIKLTKLSNYINFLSDKNLALIKMDVEGYEGKVIESGIELITKYHIPFIFLEFGPHLLKMHGTDAKKFLQMFENNGYKISTLNFFDRNYALINDLIKTKIGYNLYLVIH